MGIAMRPSPQVWWDVTASQSLKGSVIGGGSSGLGLLTDLLSLRGKDMGLGRPRRLGSSSHIPSLAQPSQWGIFLELNVFPSHLTL